MRQQVIHFVNKPMPAGLPSRTSRALLDVEDKRIVPLIRDLHETSEQMRRAEVERARKLLAKGESPEQVLEVLAQGLSHKMLHGALAELHAGDHAARERARAAIEHFFLRDHR